MGCTFSRIPFFIFHGRGLFLPSHWFAILESLHCNFNIIFWVVYHKVKILATIKDRYSDERVNDIDGVKIDFAENWVHLRKSNTEPIIRVYTEAKTMAEADALAKRFISEIEQISNN